MKMSNQNKAFYLVGMIRQLGEFTIEDIVQIGANLGVPAAAIKKAAEEIDESDLCDRVFDVLENLFGEDEDEDDC
jgi:SOS response regulatory protein OraA/RecX